MRNSRKLLTTTFALVLFASTALAATARVSDAVFLQGLGWWVVILSLAAIVSCCVLFPLVMRRKKNATLTRSAYRGR